MLSFLVIPIRRSTETDPAEHWARAHSA